MKQRDIFILIVLAGVVIGLAGSYLNYSQSTQCEEIEQQIKQKQKFNGSLACYPPGVLEVNISDQVEERAKLDCVCRKVNNGNVQLFPIVSTEDRSQ